MGSPVTLAAPAGLPRRWVRRVGVGRYGMLAPMRRAPVLVALATALVLSACGGDPVPYPPTGVDQLEIPTPSPAPGDFVEEVDNPWLPLTPGSSWTYDDGSVTVSDETRDVQGVSTTVVTDESADGTVVRLYAQDAEGNVWLFGESGGGSTWTAGTDGAEAGLAMAAEPRVGDGYRPAYAEGVAEDRVSVLALEARVSVDAGDYGDALETETVSDLEPGSVVRRFYVHGVGLVLEQVDGRTTRGLVEHREG